MVLVVLFLSVYNGVCVALFTCVFDSIIAGKENADAVCLFCNV